MQVHESETHFREMLFRADVNDATPDAEKTWQVFQSFCWLPVPDPTVLLFTSEQDDQSVFPCSRLYFERQMSVYHGVAYSHTEHLTCTLSRPLMPETQPLEDEEIVFEVGSDGMLENFVTEVEATNQFKAFMEQSQPVMLTITQGKI